MRNNATIPIAHSSARRNTGERRSRRNLFALGAAACVACCIGPILAVLGAITAAGIISAPFIGAAGLAIAAGGATAFVVLRRRRSAACETTPAQPIAVPPPTRRTDSPMSPR